MKPGVKNKPVHMKQWLSYHTYKAPQRSDFYYLNLCNEIYDIVMEHGDFDEEISLSDEEKKNLACFITGYFEDVISGPWLWKAFITQVHELYGTYLPFFDPDPDEYYPDEINPEDIWFLLWYYFSMVFSERSIISPTLYEWSDLAEEILEILEREYEVAPENFNMNQMYQVATLADNYFFIKEKLQWIMLDSWLHHFLREELNEMTAEIDRKNMEKSMSEEHRSILLYDTRDTIIMSRHTPLLARKGNEWLAFALGKDHPLFEPLMGLGEKKSAYYFYRGKEGEDLLFEHIATGTELKVTAMSMELPEETRPGRSIYFMGFVRWNEMWWLSGAQVGWGYNADLIRKEKESAKSRQLFGKDPVLEKEKNRQLHASFLKFNNGRSLAFVESEEAANHFIRDFITDEYEVIPEAIPDPVPEEQIPGMIFCSQDSGIELVFGYNSVVPDSNNRWYRKNETGEGSEEIMSRMLESPHISANFMQYLATHYSFPGLGFPGLSGRELLKNNLDFMLRFWKRNNYHD